MIKYQDIKTIDKKEKIDYCDWCWKRTYYRCYSCAYHWELHKIGVYASRVHNSPYKLYSR